MEERVLSLQISLEVSSLRETLFPVSKDFLLKHAFAQKAWTMQNYVSFMERFFSQTPRGSVATLRLKESHKLRMEKQKHRNAWDMYHLGYCLAPSKRTPKKSSESRTNLAP